MDQNTPEYYARREQQERELAAAALDPTIKAIHLDLAERYAALARPEPKPKRKTLGLATDG